MARVYQSTNPNQWLGGPRTAKYTLPITAGYTYGQNQQDPAQVSGGKVRCGGAQLYPGASSIFGIVVLIADSDFVAGLWTTGTSTYSDNTANAQSGTADAFVTTMGTTNNGFIVGAKQPFNILSVDVSTVGGASGAADYAYWGQPTTGVVGTANWQAVATNLIVPATRFSNATGENLVVANFPPDLMVKTAAGDFIGAPSGYYWFRIRATTAMAAACKFARIYPGTEIIRSAIAQTTPMTLAGGTGVSPRAFDRGVAVGSFWGTTNAGHHFYFEYE